MSFHLLNVRGMDDVLYQYYKFGQLLSEEKQDVGMTARIYHSILNYSSYPFYLDKFKNISELLALTNSHFSEKYPEIILQKKISNASDSFCQEFVQFIDDQIKKYPEKYGKMNDLYKSIFASNILNLQPGLQDHNASFKLQFDMLFDHMKIQEEFNVGSFMLSRESEDQITLTADEYRFIIGKNKIGLFVVFTEHLGYVDEDYPDEDVGINWFTFDQQRFFINICESPFTLSHLLLYLGASAKFIKREKNVTVHIDERLKTYEYHLAYFHTLFEQSKEEIVWRLAYYALPKGFDENGNYFFDKDDLYLPYNELAIKAMSTIHQDITHKDFPILTTLSHSAFNKLTSVNENWLPFLNDVKELSEKHLTNIDNHVFDNEEWFPHNDIKFIKQQIVNIDNILKSHNK